jgi:NurA domain
MPFENEFASYEPLRRIAQNEKVQALQKRLRIRDENTNLENILKELVDKSNLSATDWQPDMILAIDGSYHSVPAKNGFPGAELGYVTIASVFIDLEKVRALEKEDFIDPKKFRETEKTSSIDAVFPGCNVALENEDSAKSSMRRLLFEELLSHREFEGGETLLETYEYLLKLKRESGTERTPPSCPCDLEVDFQYGYQSYNCNTCGKILFSSDAMRLHELHNPSGTCGEMYGQIMSTLEKLMLIHLLRSIEKKGWLASFRRFAFVLDGPLAVFSTSSWLMKSIVKELERINNKQKEINGVDMMIIGIEKSGTFVNHFEMLDTEESGTKGKFENGKALLLDDKYIKENIIFKEVDENSIKTYGKDTYFGRKFFYKTKNGYRVVPNLAYFNSYQGDLKTANVNQFSRLADVMNLLDSLVSSRYANAISPLVSAHAEASIPLNLGKRIFEEIAKEIKDQSKI